MPNNLKLFLWKVLGRQKPDELGNHQDRVGHVVTLEKPIANSELKAGALYVIAPKGISKWVSFVCPCRCGQVIALSLQIAHKPHWQLSFGEEGEATLWPSIWRDIGCFSHFWIEQGRIIWCRDSGEPPTLRPWRI